MAHYQKKDSKQINNLFYNGPNVKRAGKNYKTGVIIFFNDVKEKIIPMN